MRPLFTALAAGALGLSVGTAADAKSVDLVFVIDQSGSMANEFSDLGANLGIVLGGLQAAPEIDSAAAALVTYEGRGDGAVTLQQDMTTSVGDLQTAFSSVRVRGGTEDSLAAVDAAVPGGPAGFLGISYRPDTVRSVVLITDEDADDARTYSYGGLTGYEALGSYLDDAGYLNNIITSTFLFDTYAPAARPAGTTEDPYRALFDLAAFNRDPVGFLTDFTAEKVQEVIAAPPVTGGPITGPVITPVPVPIPLPASVWLLGAGLGALGLGRLRRRRPA